MSGFDMSEMQEMQKALQDKYKDKWEPIGPETGKNKMLWMIGEIGEVIDIVKAVLLDYKKRLNEIVEQVITVATTEDDINVFTKKN